MVPLRKLKGRYGDKGKVDIMSASSEESDGNSMEIDSADSEQTTSPRGRTRVDRRVRGVKMTVRLNTRGQPIGPEGAKMQSYIGKLVRKQVNITYKTWKHVPEDVKEEVWKSVNLKYNVDRCWKKACWTSASNKWRQYKTSLTKNFVWKYKDQPEELSKPPKGHFITEKDWSAFVIGRMTDSFKKRSEEQKERRKANVHPHRLSRKGYAGLAEDIKNELCDDDEINRAIMWKKARVNKEGEIEGDDLKEKVAKIDNYIEQKKEGTLHINEAKEDILTKSLGNQEHSGRVRGFGGLITPSMYFNVVPRKKQVDQGEMVEQKKKLTEINGLIAEHDSQLKDHDARLQKLEAIIIKKMDIDNEEKFSCSVKAQHQSNEDGLGAVNNYVHDKVVDEADVQFVDRKDVLEGSSVALALESKNEIAAYGTIIRVDGPGNFLDGVLLPKNCMCVAIDEVLDESAPLPVKIPRMCNSLGDAIGNHVAWPAHLIKMQNEKTSTKKVGDGKGKTKVIDTKMPRDLYMFLCCCKNVLNDEKTIPVTLDDDVFGSNKVVLVNLTDITQFCELEPISCNCIIVYIWHLYKKMKDGFVDDFLFVDPYFIGHMPTTRTDKRYLQQQVEVRARFLANRLSSASINQLVLAPCNIGYHWILTVIDPYKEIVYLLDPLGPRIRDKTWKDVVNRALKMFNADMGRKGRKPPQWKVIKAPIQPDEKQCGFYVMRYMKEILHECLNVTKVPLQTIFTNDEYDQAQIDEVRSEWAQCIQDHMFE